MPLLRLQMRPYDASFFRSFLSETGLKVRKPTLMHENNNACISLATREVCGSRAKHINIQVPAVRSFIKEGWIRMVMIAANEQVADGLTMNKKSKEQYLYFWDRIQGTI